MKEVLHIYCRVSTSSQAEQGTSLESQQESGIRKAKSLRMDYEIHNEEAASSSKEDFSNRPVLMQVLRGIEDGDIKHLYVYNTDRLSRNTHAWSIIRKKLQDAECILYTDTGRTDLSSNLDNLIFGILSEISQYDNALRTERLREGKRKRALQGFWFGGPAPFGYKISAEKKLEIDKTQAKWVRKIYSWYAKGKSPKWIKIQLDGNIPTNRGKSVWSIGSVEAILRNPHPGGSYTYLHKEIPCPRIVEESVWNSVQNRLQNLSQRVKGNNQTRYSYPLKEIMFCGHCGTRIGGRSTKSKNGNYRFAYLCNSKANQWRIDSKEGDWDRSTSCQNNVSMEAERTEDAIWETLLLVIKESNQEKEKVKKRVLMVKDLDESKKDKQIRLLESKISKAEGQIRDIEETIAQKELEKVLKQVSESQADKVISTLTEEHAKLSNSVIEHRNEIESLKTSENWVDWIKAFESDQKGLESLPRDERIEVIKQYIKKIETFFDPETRCHRFEMQFHLPIVNDNLVWNAAGNKKSGYKIQEGSDLAVLTAKKNFHGTTTLMLD